MSTKLMSYVWDGCSRSGMKITKVTIMARLADFSNDEGICWPSVPTIARQIGAGESTVRRALRDLENEGWLTSNARRKGNRNDSNLYQLNVQKLKKLALDDYYLQTTESDPSNFDASNFDPSESSGSNFIDKDNQLNNNESIETDIFDPLNFDPSKSGGDPYNIYNNINNNTLLSENKKPDKEKPPSLTKLGRFLERHPDAHIYSPTGQYWGNQNDLTTAEWIFRRIMTVNPTQSEPNWLRWANDIRLMRQQDNRTYKEICSVFDWANKDSFWRVNVLCPEKLRKQWDKLVVRMINPAKQNSEELDWDSTDWADGLGGII